MFARWLSNQPNMLHPTAFDATESGLRLLDAGIVARAWCSVVREITGMGNRLSRLASGNSNGGKNADDLTILGSVVRLDSGFVPFAGTLPQTEAPDYPKTRLHQSHFRERCLIL